jgi:phytoene synthase
VTTPLEASYRQAEAITAKWARSFYFASRFLPPGKRRAVFAIYDYCRHADNLVDERGNRPPSLVRQDLRLLADAVREMHTGDQPGEPRWLALFDTLQRHPVPLAPLLDLLDGVATDLGPVEMADFAALHTYCRQVAGGVGLMLGPVLGARADGFTDLGVGLGVAMQLTNVLRDVSEDLDSGRLYLPADEMATWGLSRADLEARRLTPALREFLAFQVTRARQYFEAADAVVPLFPDDGSRLTVRLMQRTYAGILDRIEERGYDVFRGRAYVPFTRKLVILGRAMMRERIQRSWRGARPAEAGAAGGG